MYIYTIKNLINGKIYVGQTVQLNPKMRWYSHQADARNGKKTHLYDSIRKHGVENFLWEVIDRVNNIEQLNNLEGKWLEHYRSIGEVYNNREAGNNRFHSAESIEKMRWVKREEHARRRAEGREGGWKRIDGGAMLGKSHPGKGKKRTQEQIQRIKDGHQTMLKSEKGLEYRRKQSENSKKMWANRKLQINGGTQN